MGEQSGYEGLLDERCVCEGDDVWDVKMGKPHRPSPFVVIIYLSIRYRYVSLYKKEELDVFVYGENAVKRRKYMQAGVFYVILRRYLDSP